MFRIPIKPSQILPQCRKAVRHCERSLLFRTLTTVDSSSSHYPFATFQQLHNLHDSLKERLIQLGWNVPTEIQAKTWEAATAGRDILGRSRTGSGKTMAFLLPTLQRSMSLHDGDDDSKRHVKLILSPTRDLAQQIDELIKILHPQEPNHQHLVVVGGVDKRREWKRWHETAPRFITATPGRLRDHLEDNDSFVRDYLQNVDVLILDEVDQLLEMGFLDDIATIIRHLPQERQNLLFSATISPNIQRDLVKQGWIHSNHLFVDCISDAAAMEVQEDPFDMEHDADNKLTAATAPTLAHTHVSQSHVVLPSDRLVAGIAQIVLTLLKEDNAKILVFFPTTSMVVYFTRLFQWALGRHIWSMHGQKSQTARNVTRQAFAAAQRGVLFTTDVSARGMDYPSITTVVQVGVPASRDTYIHRLGRTGRGVDKSGKGLLVLLMQDEERIMKRELEDIEIPVDDSLSRLLHRPVWLDLELELTQFAHDMKQGELPEMVKEAESVYKSLLSIYQLQLKEEAVVETMNSFATQMGLSEPPILEENQAAYLGLSKHPLLNIHRQWKVGQRFDVGERRI